MILLLGLMGAALASEGDVAVQPATAAPIGAALNLNQATRPELDALPMLGPAKAQALLAWRSSHGPCASLADLADVPGFGSATVGALYGRATCGPAATEDANPPEGEIVLAPIATPKVVDINLASVEQLMLLPGIVEARARAIVADRERNGLFASCHDLVRVPGLGPATVANLLGSCSPP